MNIVNRAVWAALVIAGGTLPVASWANSLSLDMRYAESMPLRGSPMGGGVDIPALMEMAAAPTTVPREGEAGGGVRAAISPVRLYQAAVHAPSARNSGEPMRTREVEREREAGGGGPPNAVPLPPALWLLVAGLAFLPMRRRADSYAQRVQSAI